MSMYFINTDLMLSSLMQIELCSAAHDDGMPGMYCDSVWKCMMINIYYGCVSLSLYVKSCFLNAPPTVYRAVVACSNLFQITMNEIILGAGGG